MLEDAMTLSFLQGETLRNVLAQNASQAARTVSFLPSRTHQISVDGRMYP